MRPDILRVLGGQRVDLDGVLLKYFRVAMRLMKNEITCRLKSAVSEIENLQGNEYSELIRKAPWDLVEMMNKP
jgi:hypothetical protein